MRPIRHTMPAQPKFHQEIFRQIDIASAALTAVYGLILTDLFAGRHADAKEEMDLDGQESAIAKFLRADTQVRDQGIAAAPPKMHGAWKLLGRKEGATREEVAKLLNWPTVSIQRITRGHGRLRIDKRKRPYRYFIQFRDKKPKGTRRTAK